MRLLMVALAVLVVGSSSPDPAPVPPDALKAMQSRLEAVWKKDAVTWSKLTADEFTVVVPEGTLMTKSERLNALRHEPPEPVHAVKEENVRVYGETIVHRFRDGSEWILEVWVRQNGAWRVVAAQVNFAKR